MDITHSRGGMELFDAQSHLYKHILNYISSMSLKCAVQLGIPDIVHKHGQPITLPELVSALQIPPTKTSYVYRLMRLLVHSGFFSITKVHNDQEEEAEAYVLTSSSRLLLKDDFICLTPFVLSMIDPVLFNSWNLLGDWFRGNKLNAFENAYGMNFWDYGEQNPEFSKLFGQGMASDSQMRRKIFLRSLCETQLSNLNQKCSFA